MNFRVLQFSSAIFIASGLATLNPHTVTAAAFNVPYNSSLQSAKTNVIGVQFKASSNRTIRSLQAKGYSDIRIIKKGFTKIIAEACRNGNRFRLVLGRSLSIRSSGQIGTCDLPGIKPGEVRDMLRAEGYRSIEFIDDKLPLYIARACEDRRRFELRINKKGQIVDRKRAGRCESRRPDRAYSPERVRDILRRDGYRNIRFIDRNLPRYIVEACRDRGLFELVVDSQGQIKQRDRRGRCRDSGPKSVDPREIRSILRDKGFRRIQLIDRELPVYIAEACRNNRQFRIRLDRLGKIKDTDRIGICYDEPKAANLTQQEIRSILHGREYNRIRFTDRTPPNYRVEACKNQNRFDIRLNRNGEIVRRDKVGGCADGRNERGYRSGEVKGILEDRQYYGVELRELSNYVANACRNGRQFRLRLDRFGNIKERKRTGWCDSKISRKHKRRRFARITDSELRSRDALTPGTCQNYLEHLLDQNSIRFDVGSAEIRPESVSLLRQLAHIANRCPGTTIEIAGHTDSDGSNYDNQKLSERRARSVVSFLRNENVSYRRLSAVGYGELQPVAPNDTPWNKALNRRIEFVVDWNG